MIPLWPASGPRRTVRGPATGARPRPGPAHGSSLPVGHQPPTRDVAQPRITSLEQDMAKMGLLHILLLILSASSYSVSGEHWGPAVVGEGYLFVGVLIKHTSQSWINVNLNFQLLFNCSLAWYFPYLVCGTKFKHCVKIAAWIKLLISVLFHTDVFLTMFSGNNFETLLLWYTFSIKFPPKDFVLLFRGLCLKIN